MRHLPGGQKEGLQEHIPAERAQEAALRAEVQLWRVREEVLLQWQPEGAPEDPPAEEAKVSVRGLFVITLCSLV